LHAQADGFFSDTPGPTGKMWKIATFTGKKTRAPGEGQHRGARHGKALNKLKHIQSRGQVLTREQQARFAV